MMVNSCLIKAHDATAQTHVFMASHFFLPKHWTVLKLLLAIMPVSIVMYTFMLLWENLCGVNMTENFHSVICDHWWIYSTHSLHTWSVISTKLQTCFYHLPLPFLIEKWISSLTACIDTTFLYERIALFSDSLQLLAFTSFSEGVIVGNLFYLTIGLIKGFNIPWSFVLRTVVVSDCSVLHEHGYM